MYVYIYDTPHSHTNYNLSTVQWKSKVINDQLRHADLVNRYEIFYWAERQWISLQRFQSNKQHLELVKDKSLDLNQKNKDKIGKQRPKRFQ